METILADLFEEDMHTFMDVEKIELNGRYGAFEELPLHIFAIRGDLEACRILVEAGSEVNVPGEHGFTPLHEAVSQGHPEVVKLLLKYGADPALETTLGSTEFLASEHPEILPLLKRHKLCQP